MTDFKAKLINENLTLTGVVTGGAWSAELPAINVADDRLVTHPARCEDPTDLAASQFDVALARRRIVKFLGLFATNLSVTAQVRLTFADDAAFANVIEVVGWVPVYERFHASASLDWEDANFWTGTPLEKDLDLYGRHKTLLFETSIPAAHCRIEIDDTLNPAGHIDIGYLYIGTTIETRFNFERGRQLTAKSRAARDETPSGHAVFDRRRPKRVQRVTYSDLSEGEVAAFLDAGMRNDVIDPVVFIPDPTDPLAVLRGTFLGRFVELPGAHYRFDGYHQSQIQIEEILA